ncbi:DNA-binding transcriptional LysR family regulator [Streptosporangium becharense]|uniref:DNA-binding transcriptional LysR family regulator n=1 Tax=Streptosporangium becharense TaxID=1816182 RepID=A0A7W9IJH3_9ACTN|nr:LysR substrate-binding domain-containing protein [Streptosporangium becharense]MBB2911029.1 DNA-binding transcriptional LysR family regulator [Streptosporangium becharense]MBB5821913.1 DNA-binding transcriptional LysR family regulator [Streptosporangium becharense]
MELRQLEYFVAVAEEASFTRAAARLYVAQPGVSAQIRRLERELGQELLDRTGRTVRLTEVGTAVLAHARAVLDGVAGVRLVVDEFTGLIRGRVSMGMVRSCSSVDLPTLLADFHKDYPAVEITLSEENSDQLLDGVRSGRFDVAIVAVTAVDPPNVELQVIVDEPLVIAVSHSDQMAKCSTVTIDALRDRALISLPRGTGMRACLDEACAAAGFEPRVAFEVSDPAVLTQLAVRGLGPAVLPASIAAGYPGELHAITVTRPRLHGRMALAWRAEGPVGPAARVFIDHARIALAGTPAREEPDVS